jgi:lipopolysaccharide transport system ATP-binding protein
MQAVQSLCKTAIYLKAGHMADIGDTDKVINNYLSREVTNCIAVEWDNENDAPGNEYVSMISARINPKHEKDAVISVATEMDITFEFFLHKACNLNISFFLNTPAGLVIFNIATPSVALESGMHSSTLTIPGRLLNDDIYTIRLFFVKDGGAVIYQIEDILTFEVVDEARTGSWFGKWPGAVRPNLPFTLT